MSNAPSVPYDEVLVEQGSYAVCRGGGTFYVVDQSHPSYPIVGGAHSTQAKAAEAMRERFSERPTYAVVPYAPEPVVGGGVFWEEDDYMDDDTPDDDDE